ncbi:hypothetical protein B4Q13_21830 [Lacticaseibacillus rhamnosus]
MAQTIQAVRGMNDVLPEQAPLWEFFEETVRVWLAQYGYRGIRMPILEKTELFVRSIGEVTDTGRLVMTWHGATIVDIQRVRSLLKKIFARF